MLEFTYKKRIYELRFNVFPVIQIAGKSASGKSLLCSDLRKIYFRRVEMTFMWLMYLTMLSLQLLSTEFNTGLQLYCY